MEDAELDDAVMRNYYREVLHVTLPTAAQKARHAWRQYADPQFPGCPYIEFTASDAGELSRYVWDYQNDQWYIGVHYNWVHGYNPFIFVRGMQPSLSTSRPTPITGIQRGTELLAAKLQGAMAQIHSDRIRQFSEVLS
jgi:hypothetical protein